MDTKLCKTMLNRNLFSFLENVRIIFKILQCVRKYVFGKNVWQSHIMHATWYTCFCKQKFQQPQPNKMQTSTSNLNWPLLADDSFR